MELDELLVALKPYTVISADRLTYLNQTFKLIENIPGAIVECGVARGGSAAYIWNGCGRNRHLWMFDSWEGHPQPTDEDPYWARKKYSWKVRDFGAWAKFDIEDVMKAMEIGGVDLDLAHPVKGWFKDTIPATYEQIGPIAFLHLDADWYLSTQICLKYLYPLLVPGGILEIDDNGLSGCDLALQEYGLWNKLTISPHEFGAWLVKEA